MESDLSTRTMGTDLPSPLVERRSVWGVTLAAYAIPVALAYATLAGLPPQVGVYGYLLGGLGYALFGSSRRLAIGPTSAISLMVGVSVAPLAMGNPARYAQIVVEQGDGLTGNPAVNPLSENGSR